MRKPLAGTCLALSLAIVACPGEARADDWSLTRERPSRPARGPSSPPRRPETRAPARPAVDRFLEAALRDPSADVLVDHLIARRRRAEGGLAALRAELSERGGLEARVLLARIAAEDGALDEARDVLRALVDEERGAALAARALAAVERRFGDVEAVPGLLDLALERATSPSEREALLREKMALHLDRGELSEAEAAVEALYAARPRDVSLRFEWARELARRDRSEEAVGAFEAALSMARGDARVAAPIRIELARARLASGDEEGALRDLDRARRAAGGAAYRAAVLELEIAVHRRRGTLEELAEGLASRRDADSLAARARLLDELGEDEAATAAYRQALRRRPRDRDLRAALARLYARMGRLEEVVSEYRRLLRETGGDPTFVRELALLYDRLGRRDEADRLLRDLARSHPRSAGIARVDAELRERFDDREGFRAALERWKRIDPSDPEPRIVLGAELLAAGDRAAAVRELRGLLELGGEPVESRVELARVLADHDLLDEAERAMEPIAASVDERLEAARVLASILERPRVGERAAQRSERNARAEALWEKVLEHPRADEEARREARRHIVQIARAEGRLEEKIAALEAAVRDDPGDLRSARLLAEAHLAHAPEDPGRALAILERMAAKGGDVDVLEQLARVRRKAGDREGEIALLERLASLDSRGAARHLDRLVQLSLELYRDEDALRFAAEAARRAPHDAAAHRRLAALHRERRDLDAAAVAYRRALALDDAHVPTLSELAALELARGDVDASLGLQLRIVRVSPDDELVGAAGHAALRLATTPERLSEVEAALVPLAISAGSRPVFRRLLLPVFEAAAREGGDRASLARRSAKVLVETLFEGDEASRRRALRLIERLAPESAAGPLMAFAGAEMPGALRARALVARAALEAPIAAAALEPRITDADRRVRVAAAWAAHRRGPLSLRLRLLDAGDPNARAIGALSFAERPSANAAERLRARFRDDVSADVRAAAALALGRLGSEGDLADLAKAALGAPPRERRAALAALAGTESREAIEALATAFFDESPVLRRVAQGALWAGAPPTAELEVDGIPRVAELLDRLIEPEWPRRASLEPRRPALARAARAMLAGPVERRLATLRVLNAREALEPESARFLAGELAEDVEALLAHPDARVRREAVTLLVSLDAAHAARALARALADEEDVARIALDRAEAALTEESRALVEAAAVDGGSWAIRRSAVALLGRGGASVSRLVLEQALADDSHAVVRAAAAAALRGLDASAAALERAAEVDPSAEVRQIASEALRETFD